MKRNNKLFGVRMYIKLGFTLVATIILCIGMSFKSIAGEEGKSNRSGDNRAPIKISKEDSLKLSKKMSIFLKIVSNISEAILDKNFKVIKEESFDLSEFTKKNRNITPKSAFDSLKKNMSKSAFTLYKSAEKQNIKEITINFNRTVKSCVACHSSFRRVYK
ncbi:MAG: cytochrome c [Bdellovibrionota bacterium]|nr:cytochrome c [Bdellovibrionota bacterium]